MSSPLSTTLTDIDNADVYIDDVQVATLTRQTNDTIEFDYSTLSSTGSSIRSHSVSWSLLANGHYPVVTTGGAVPPSSQAFSRRVFASAR